MGDKRGRSKFLVTLCQYSNADIKVWINSVVDNLFSETETMDKNIEEFEHELELLSDLINLVCSVLRNDLHPAGTPPPPSADMVLKITDISFKMFTRTHNSVRCCKKVTDILVAIFPFMEEKTQDILIETAIDSIRACTDESNQSSLIPVVNAVSLLASISGKDVSEEKISHIVNVMKETILVCEEELACLMIGCLFPAVWRYSTCGKSQIAVELLDKAVIACDSRTTDKIHTQPGVYKLIRYLMIICGILPLLRNEKDCLFLENDRFWCAVQNGFCHEDTLSRKRSLFILKTVISVLQQNKISLSVPNAVFYWNLVDNDDLMRLWEEFTLVVETLEEKQVHVIRPMMPKLQKLINSTSRKGETKTLLHTSWIVTIFRRIANHESSYIRRWGMEELLKIDLQTFPLLEQCGDDFHHDNFVKMLTDSSLYHKQADVILGNCPALVTALGAFLDRSCQAMADNQRCSFLRNFVTGIRRHNWSGAALVYVVKAMSEISPCRSIGADSISDLIQILTSSTNTLHAKFRGPIEQYSTVFAMNCLDKTDVTPATFAGLLATVSSAETLKRGTRFWSKLCAWFADAVKDSRDGAWTQESIGVELARMIDCFVKDKTAADMNTDMVVFSHLLNLMVDSDLISTKQSCEESALSLQLVLSPLLQIAVSMGTHAYLSEIKAHRTLLGLITVVEGAIPYAGCERDSFWRSLRTMFTGDLVSSVLQFLSRSVFDAGVITAQTFVDAYSDFIRVANKLNSEMFFNSRELVNLLQSCQVTLNSKQAKPLQRYCSMRLVAAVSESLQEDTSAFAESVHRFLVQFVHNMPILCNLPKPELANMEPRTHKAIPWGKISSQFLESQWQCIYLNLKYAVENDPQELDPEKYASHCLETLDVVGEMAVVPVLKCVQLILPKVSVGKKCEFVQIGWCKVVEEGHQYSFWPVYSSYLAAVLQDCTLTAGPDTAVFGKLNQVFDEIFRVGEEKEGLINMLIFALCDWWRQNPDHVTLAENYTDHFVQAIMFGPVHSKGKRFQNEVHQYLLRQGEELAINQLADVTSCDDVMVRVYALRFISQLKTDIPQHSTYAVRLAQRLITIQRDLLLVNSYKQFTNSLSHRQKHRIFTALLVLLPFLSKIHQEVFEFLVEVLIKENQPSARSQAEWLLQRLLLKHPHYIETLWQYLSEGSDKKPVFLCSIVVVMTQLAKLFTGQSQGDFILKAIPRVLPWAMTQQFSLRTFAQGSLVTLWNICTSKNIREVLLKHSVIQSFVTFTESQERTCKAINKLLGTFTFHIDPIGDYNIETLVHTLPHLAGMTDEEWVEPALFERECSTWEAPGEHNLALWSGRKELKNCTPGSWKVKNMGKEDDITEADGDVNGDVQKKAIPWTGLLPQQDLEADLRDEYAHHRNKTNPLVVVATLIDKIPNLGGLCRTSEVFGVSEYVMGSIKYLEDVNFSSLSVTAHKWIPVREVKVAELKSYLREMKEEGYTLVGAEQTANSVCLTDYTFPEKTLLLLGNEKEGIPVDLIQLLDVCVEIPQQGLVRSLNVHVSGALLVWEYTRQQLVKATCAP